MRVIDAGGNVTESPAFTATSAASLNGTNATAVAKLTATFARPARKLDVGYGKTRPRSRGRLTDATGARSRARRPGARPRAARRHQYARALEVTTDAAGRFSVLPGHGAARAIRFEYRSRRFLPAADAADSVELRVAAGATLSVSPKRVRPRGTITISGRLRGLPLPRSGKVVDLQAYEGGKWRDVRHDAGAQERALHSRYRFLRAGSGATFLIRARIRRDDAYPYYLGYSPRVRVRVR